MNQNKVSCVFNKNLNEIITFKSKLTIITIKRIRKSILNIPTVNLILLSEHDLIVFNI